MDSSSSAILLHCSPQWLNARGLTLTARLAHLSRMRGVVGCDLFGDGSLKEKAA
jgi:hypothetical protein